MAETRSQLPKLDELCKRLALSNRARLLRYRLGRTMRVLVWPLAFVLAFGAFALMGISGREPGALRLVLGMIVFVTVFFGTRWLMSRAIDWLTMTLVRPKFVARRLGLLCPHCGYRLDWDFYRENFFTVNVTQTGRCASCRQTVVRDPPPEDAVLPSPFALNEKLPHRLITAFVEPCRFSLHGETIELKAVTAGVLRLPTGKIEACDPIYVQESTAIDVGAGPGEYPVDLLIAMTTKVGQLVGERVACARIKLTSEPTVRYVGISGYGVDNGIGCYMDKHVADFLRSFDEEQFQQFWQHMNDEDASSSQANSFATSFCVDSELGGNMIVFESGLGDGGYPVFLGYDANDKPTSLVTDFGFLFAQQDLEYGTRKRWWQFWR